MQIVLQNKNGHSSSSLSQLKLSNKIFISIFLLICLNSYILCANSLVILPFRYINNQTKTSSPITTTPKDYFESFLKYNLFSTIKINDKPLDFHLTLDRHTTYISEKTLQEIDAKSAVIQEDEDLYSLKYIGILRAKYTNSSFSFLTNNTQNITTNNYSFFMMRNFTDDNDYIKRTKYHATLDAEIGLNVIKGNKIERVTVKEDEVDPYDKGDEEEEEDPYGPYGPYDPEDENAEDEKKKLKVRLGEKYVTENNGYLIEQNTNLIAQLKKQSKISSYTFMIKYDNKNEEKGTISIGGLPHEYDPYHYSIDYFISIKASFGEGYGNWGLIFNQVLYNGEIYQSIKSAEISLDFGFILSTEAFRELLNKHFFEKGEYAKYCKEEKINSYYVKYCEEKVIKDFKNISFVLPVIFNDNNQSNILEFDYNDLFIKAPGNTNLYYFQIIFEENFYSWKLGRPLFKKYPAIFDQDKRIFGFYKETGNYTVEEKNDTKKEEEREGGLSLAWVMVIILSICLIGLGFAFYKVLPYIKKKKRANELDDDYEYNTGISMKKEENNNLINEEINN